MSQFPVYNESTAHSFHTKLFFLSTILWRLNLAKKNDINFKLLYKYFCVIYNVFLNKNRLQLVIHKIAVLFIYKFGWRTKFNTYMSKWHYTVYALSENFL